MTNIGGPDFVVVVFGLFAILASPVLAGVSAVVIRWERWRPGRTLLVVNGGAVLAAAVVVLAWTLVGGPVSLATTVELVGLILATTVAVLVLLEALPLWAGFALASRRGMAARDVVSPVVGGWVLGGLAGVALAALVTQSILALLAAIPGAWVGAVGLGPVLATRRGT